ncbi:MAG: hypothetical protein PHW76_08570, partial [Alphaproteobacteria bacterium]|nr:hypothetical protein [Alphaproteobacteria bacterium]
MKKTVFFKRCLRVLVVGIFFDFFAPLPVLAGEECTAGGSKACNEVVWRDYSSANYVSAKSEPGTTIGPIDVPRNGGKMACRYVVNATEDGVFVPFRSPTEWDHFIQSPNKKIGLRGCSRKTSVVMTPNCTLSPSSSAVSDILPYMQDGYSVSAQPVFVCMGNKTLERTTYVFKSGTSADTTAYTPPNPADFGSEASGWKQVSRVSEMGGCGSADGKSFGSAPTTNLCSSNTISSDVTLQDTTWTWTCQMTGFMLRVGAAKPETITATATCSASLAASCGSADGVATYTKPTFGLCASGTSSAVTDVDGEPYTWTCTFGKTTASCSAPRNTYGRCGSANGVSASSFPTSGLCSEGDAVNKKTDVNADPAFTWNCKATTVASCSAPLEPKCGSANGGTFASIPTKDLCSSGDASKVNGTGPWTWTCSAGGKQAACSASILEGGVCGSANGKKFASKPSSGLCAKGTASSVAGSGPWTWTCAGAEGGSVAYCSALLKADGVCGSASGVPASTKPTSYLCSVGTASTVSGSGPWSWTCSGLGGGAAASCSTLTSIDGICGSSADTSLRSEPTSNLCSAGMASKVSGSGPWTWTCVGQNGGSDALCKALLKIDGVCGSANDTATASKPTSNLCSKGTPSTVAGSGPWTWSCLGQNGGSDASCKASFKLDGTCGSANGTGAESRPTSNLCSNGKASKVAGTGPWTWSCAGENGGSTDSCSAPVRFDGVCGSANDTATTKKPTSNLCSAGTASKVAGSGPWTWSCAGENGGSTASCEASAKINGTCGSADGVGRTSKPTTNLCSAGTSSTVAGSGPWTWSCIGAGGGSDASCKAPLMVNGICGSADGAVATSKPTSNLCSKGTASTVAGSGPWTWSCIGAGGGSDASCDAPLKVNGVCGPADGVGRTSKPTSNLCSKGTASTVAGSGPWTWTCAGENGGSDASCKAPLKVNGACGSADGTAMASKPTTNLCSAGTSSTVAGSGPWTWTCAGEGGGTDASCKALAKVNGVCGSADGVSRTSKPTSNLCSAGTASTVAGSGPWTWRCGGENGGSTASCDAPLKVNGVCG